MDTHPLRTLLQLNLNSDANAAYFLPHVLANITADALQPSSHTQKWTNRIQSLLHSKDASARWAGLCIALQTSIHSHSIMTECAQGWVGVVLPLLTKNESAAVIKGAIRLLRYIFGEAVSLPEFQRQVATPNVPKLATALVSLAEKADSEEVKVVALESLARLVPLYPTLHRAQLNALSSVALRYLNGSAPKPTSPALREAASGLYAVLHHTGGKVGAATHWRKSVDETIAFAWGALHNLRTTFPILGSQNVAPPPASREDPAIFVPLSLDRLRAAVTVLCDLLSTSNARPIVLPIGPLVRLCVSLLSCTSSEEDNSPVDPSVRALESSAVPHIWTLGCELVEAVAESAEAHLAPHLSQLAFNVIRRLEGELPADIRTSFLCAATALLSHCPALSDPILPSRLARAVLPTLTTLLAPQSQMPREDGVSGIKSRKGKKRARAYEGDEVFKTRDVICPTKADGEVVVEALNVLDRLMKSTPLSPQVQSIGGRLLLAIYMALPQTPPSMLSNDLSLHGRVYEVVQRICVELGTSTSNVMSKSLGLIIGTSYQGTTTSEILREVDLMLHPRVPPLVRAVPHVESLSLYRAEEGDEEQEMRRGMGIVTLEDGQGPRDATPQANGFAANGPPSSFSASLPLVQGDVAMSNGTQSEPTVAPVVPTNLSRGDVASDSTATVPSSRMVDAGPAVDPPPSATQARSPLPSLPPPPDALPTSTAALPSKIPPKTPSVAISNPQPVVTMSAMVVDEEDEPMPGIDLGSDSDEDEE